MVFVDIWNPLSAALGLGRATYAVMLSITPFEEESKSILQPI